MSVVVSSVNCLRLAYLGLGDPVDPHGLDQVVDPPGRHPLHVGGTDDRDQGLFGPTAGLEQELGAVDAAAA